MAASPVSRSRGRQIREPGYLDRPHRNTLGRWTSVDGRGGAGIHRPNALGER